MLTWHFSATCDIAIGASLYRLDWDVDGAHWTHVSGPEVDAGDLDAIAHDVGAYEYHPTMARLYRAGEAV